MAEDQPAIKEEQQPEHLLTDFNDKKKELDGLKDDISDIQIKRSTLLERKKQLRAHMTDLLAEIKTLREERNSLTNEVKSIKVEREKVHGELKVKIEEAKKVQKVPVPKMEFKPDFLLKKIQSLEQSIETTPMSFDKEQKVMKKIKELQKEYKAVEKVDKEMQGMRDLNKAIKKLKKDGEAFHKQVQEKAELSQQKHERLLKLSEELDVLRKEEEAVTGELLEIQKQFDSTEENLAGSLVEVSALGRELHEKRKEKRAKRMLAEKSSVEEKIKKGKKLTTQDLLAYQAGEE